MEPLLTKRICPDCGKDYEGDIFDSLCHECFDREFTFPTIAQEKVKPRICFLCGTKQNILMADEYGAICDTCYDNYYQVIRVKH